MKTVIKSEPVIGTVVVRFHAGHATDVYEVTAVLEMYQYIWIAGTCFLTTTMRSDFERQVLIVLHQMVLRNRCGFDTGYSGPWYLIGPLSLRFG